MNANQISQIASTQPEIFDLCESHSVAEDSHYESETQSYFFEDGSRIEMCGIARTIKFYQSGNENEESLEAFKTIDY